MPDGDRVVECAVTLGVTELFVQVPLRPGTHERRQLRWLMDAASEHGIEVAALGGDPSWPDRPEEALTDWLLPVLRIGAWSAIHLDIEPMLDQRRPDLALVTRFVALVGRMAEQTHDRGLEIEQDMPFWYPQIPLADTDLTTSLLAYLDGVTVMTYQLATDDPDESISRARPTIERAHAARRSSRVGLETLIRGGWGADSVSLSGRSRGEFEEARGRIDESFDAVDGYRGVAVRDLGGYAALGEETTSR
jgi:hypothetical protein